MGTKIIMPEMGEGIIEATVAQWLKNEGDKVEQYEPLLEIETDKVTTEATAEGAGTLLKILVAEGETVPVGTLLAFIGQPGETMDGEEAETTAVTASPAPAAQSTGSSTHATHTNGRPTESRHYTGRISPVVSRIASENEVNLDLVPGTGRDGRITKKDILDYVEQRDSLPASPPVAAALKPPAPEPQPKQAAPAPADGDIVSLTSMRRSIAEHMVRSKHTSPHVTTVFEFDFTAVAAHRAAHKEQFARDNARLTFTAYLVAATVAALKEHPLANSSWSDEGIVLHRSINLGMATALDEGLIVPVIKNADSLNLLGLARTINDLADRARRKQLRPEETQGGTFTITNHGVSGSLFATPIINQPQCGILGVGQIEKRVKVINDAIAIRPLAYVSFTFDHRILDGATADYFVAAIKKKIENWQ
ncbi:MAG: 2-oxo acid dehydrogenase subunit E2 [Ardenticatenaceae bacterium]|nr:2-oxo acid dehydrogenase subunit E2 [Ardenticatenaceae bacterium]MCB8987958.1 2-oxo acid dehydrogenase subunit E2 [Ardenticatenaceae bacterium]